MDFNRNADKIDDTDIGVSFNQIIDVDNSASVTQELFSVGQFKQQYGKIDNDYEDDLIEALISTARSMCEKYVGMNLVQRNVIAIINNLNGGTYLPFGPVGSISSVKDIDDNDISDHKIIGEKFKQILWPDIDYVKVSYQGGWSSCPPELVNAVKAQTLFLSQNRGDATVGMSPVAAMILNPLKRPA